MARVAFSFFYLYIVFVIPSLHVGNGRSRAVGSAHPRLGRAVLVHNCVVTAVDDYRSGRDL